MNSHNWWKYAFGPDFDPKSEYVKKAFVYVYDELKKAGREDKVSLIYNDYSTYAGNTAEQIIDLINSINTKDDINPYGKVCSGVGMQSHMSTQVTTNDISSTIKKFADQGYEIQITELDIVDHTKQDIAEKDAAIAEAYYKAMETYIKAKKNGANISTIVIWGLTDATSWLDGQRPLLFGTDISDVKDAFFKVIQAAEDNK